MLLWFCIRVLMFLLCRIFSSLFGWFMLNMCSGRLLLCVSVKVVVFIIFRLWWIILL